MGTQSAHSTAKTAAPSPLYHHSHYEAYECLGCGEMIEIPKWAVLHAGKPKEEVRGNPENLLRWRELIELDHQPCINFTDAAMAKQARAHRKPFLLHKTPGMVH